MKNYQWKRVTGYDLDPNNEPKRKANEARLKSKEFVKMCDVVGLEPTKRQASKYNNKRGMVYMYDKNLLPGVVKAS